MPQNSFTTPWGIFLSPPTSWWFPREKHLHPQPLEISLTRDHLVPKPSRNRELNQGWIPTHHGYLGNCKERMEPLWKQEKTMPMTTNEPNKQMHVPFIHTLVRKSHMQLVTCRILMLKLFIEPPPWFPSLSFACPFPSLYCLLSFLQIQVNAQVLE